jgi:hypothetical protein
MMTTPTTFKVREELRDLNISHLNEPLALTLRFKTRSKWGETLDEIRAEKNIRHFLKLIERSSKVFGHRAKRYGKRLNHWFEFQGSPHRDSVLGSDYLHAHGVLDYPRDIVSSPAQFKSLVFTTWRKTPFGSCAEWGQKHRDIFCSAGWSNYITRAHDVGCHTITNLY